MGFLMCLSSFPDDSDSEGSACSAGDLGLIPGLGRSPGEGNGYPCQYSPLENSMDRGVVHGVTKSRTRLCNTHFGVRCLSILRKSLCVGAGERTIFL